MRTVASLLKQTIDEWQRDKASRLAAALAYYTVFSLAPMLVIVIAVAAMVFGHAAAQGEVMQQIRGMMGDTAAHAIEGLLASASRRRAGIVASLIGLVVLFVGATGVFSALQDGLNIVWEVTPRRDTPWWQNLLRDRLQGFLMVLGIGFLLLVLLVVSAAISTASEYFGNLFNAGMAHWLNLGISFAIITVLFAMMYKLLPDAEIAWGDVWIGAAATSILFTVGKQLIGLYLGRGTISSAYGAAGSLVLILAWVYYSAQIFFIGAEFTQVYANRFGSKIRPKANAMRMTAGQRAEEGMP